MEGEERHQIILACAGCGALFSVLSVLSVWILWAVNWRPWRIYSWIFARKWPKLVQGRQLSVLCSFLSLFAWVIVLSPIIVVISWGSILISILSRDIIGLAVIMAGTALLLAFYSIMLWWRTQWQSSNTYDLHIFLSFCRNFEAMSLSVSAMLSKVMDTS